MAPRSARGFRELLLATTCLVAAAPAWAQPVGGKVTAGQGAISTPSATSTVISQATDKLVIDWQSFSIPSASSVTFVQPGADSIAFNRVTGSAASLLDGNLTANGHVWLSNPNGIVVGPGARVDVHGLLATTAGMSNENFLAGNFLFDQPGKPGAAVVNRGEIRAGSVVLAGEHVANDGLIVADMGSVTLGGAKTFAVDLWGDKLLRFEVKDGADAPLVENAGRISAAGGRVVMTARAARSVVDNVINSSGVVEAQTARMVNGEIVFDAGDTGAVQVAGRVDASGKGAGETGGTVKVLGARVALADASIDASGAAGGGTVLVGGNFHGAGPERNAAATYVSSGSAITADAIVAGDGGKVAVWADGTTAFGGTVSARGGAAAGNGGFVETSGKQRLSVAKTAKVDTRAPTGKTGTWLLDPHNIVVQSSVGVPLSAADMFATTPGTDVTIDPATLNAATSNVVLQANNDVVFNSSVAISAPGIGLTAQAGRSIILNGGAGIATNDGAVTLIANDSSALAAYRDPGTGMITMASGTTIATGAGDVTLTVGTGVAGAASGNITLGSITTTGTVVVRNDGLSSGSGIFAVDAGSLITAGALALSVAGDGAIGASPASPIDVAVSGALAAGAGGGAINITATSGALYIGTVDGISGLTAAGGAPLFVKVGSAGMTIDAPVIADGPATFYANSGFVLNSSAAIYTGSQPLEFHGAVGSSFTQNSGATISAGGPMLIEADSLALVGATGSLFGPQITLIAANRMGGATIGVGTATGDLSIPTTTLDQLTGFGQVQIGTGGAAITQLTIGGSLAVNTDVEFIGQNVALDPTAALTAGFGVSRLAFSNGASAGTFTQTSGATIDAGYANLRISADSIALNGPAGSLHGLGKVSLEPGAPGGSVGVGAASGSLVVSQATIDALQSFAGLEIHAADAAPLIIGGSVTTGIPTLFGGNSVELLGSASVTSTAVGPSSLIFAAEVPMSGGTIAYFSQDPGATVHAGDADLYISADQINLNGTSQLFGNASVTLAGATDHTAFDELPSTHSISVGSAGGPGLHVTQSMLDSLLNFSSLRLHAGPISSLGIVFPIDGTVAAGTPQTITIGGPVQFYLPTTLDANAGQVILLGGTTIATNGASLDILSPIALIGSAGSMVTIDTTAGTAEIPGPSYASSAAVPGGDIFILHGIEASSSGPVSLTLDAGDAGIAVLGQIGATYPLDTLRVAGSGYAFFSGLTAANVDLSGKTGGDVEFLNATRFGNILTSSAPYSVAFYGTGKFGDPTFSNTGGLTLIGNYVTATDLIATAGTTILGGTITATGSASLVFGDVVLIQPTTIQNLGTGSVQVSGSITALGDYNLYSVNSSGVVTTLYRGDPTPTATENLVQQVVAPPKIQTNTSLTAASAPLAAIAPQTLSGISLTIAPPPALTVATATSITETGTQTTLATSTAGFEVQLEASGAPAEGGSSPSGEHSGGKNEGGSSSSPDKPAGPEPHGPPPTAGSPQDGSKPPSQPEAKPISPVTAVVPGLVGQVRPTVLRAPAGVPGIAQPYSSDGNIGRW